MKSTIRIVQIFVGVLFIVSGLVKANDPLGLSYKMQEFFELWRDGHALDSFVYQKLTSLHNGSLALSITVITLEIVTGVALLLGWMKKFILWFLLLLIIFFTFLTGYAYLSGKFTNCGCFGDCLPITPLTSFLKDIVLLIMILFLLFGQRYIKPVFTRNVRAIVLTLSLVVSLFFQWYVLNYLPFADCLPFKKGNNIAEQMKPPINATPDVTETRLVYKNKISGDVKDMSQDEFNASKIWTDTTWKWQETKTKLIKKGNNQPAINGFSLIGVSGQDSTQIILSQPLAIIGFGLDSLRKTSWLNDLKKIVDAAKAKNSAVYFSTNEREKFEKEFVTNNISIPVFGTDFTPVKTAARTNPTFYLLKQGTIIGKYSYRKLNNLLTDLQKL